VAALPLEKAAAHPACWLSVTSSLWLSVYLPPYCYLGVTLAAFDSSSAYMLRSSTWLLCVSFLAPACGRISRILQSSQPPGRSAGSPPEPVCTQESSTWPA